MRVNLNLSPAPQPVPNLSPGDATEPVPKAHRVPRRGTWLAGTRSRPVGSRLAGQKLRGEVCTSRRPSRPTCNRRTNNQRRNVNAGTRRHQDGHWHHYRLPLPGSTGARAVKANVVTEGQAWQTDGRTARQPTCVALCAIMAKLKRQIRLAKPSKMTHLTSMREPNPASEKEAAAVWVSRSALKPWGKNPRKNDAAVAKVVESIKRFGFGAPIIARSADGEVIAGHTRLRAAEALGLDRVPVRYLDLDPAEAHLLALADNKLGEVAEWDAGAVASILSEYGLEDAALAGWDSKELDTLAASLDPGEPAVDDVEPDVSKAEELRQKWGVETGQLWVLGEHRLLCGDSTKAADVARLMGEEKASLVVTDPPYGVAVAGGAKDPRDTKNFQSGRTIENDDLGDEELESLVSSALRNAAAVMRPGAAFYVWHPSSRAELFARAVRVSLAPYRQIIIWAKEHFVFGRQDYHWQHEPCFYGWIDGAHTWHGERNQSTVWKGAPVGTDLEKRVHPTSKPIWLVTKPILNHTVPGDCLYEPFSGSGTALMACEQFGRRCRAIELDPAYVAVAIERWHQATGRTPERDHG